MLCLLHEGVWFERQRCEQAEGRYQTVLAERHGGLKIEVCCFKAGDVDIIARAFIISAGSCYRC